MLNEKTYFSNGVAKYGAKEERDKSKCDRGM